MINEDTVLILGAGASHHCGYPMGQVLYHRIIDQLNLIDNEQYASQDFSKTEFRQLEPVAQLLRLGYEYHSIKNFRSALLAADRPSIDKFLERRTDLIEIGKVCIAQALIPLERESELTNRSGKNWYQLLFSELDYNVKGFHNNRLSIVTFNYDRSLEHYLFNAVKHTYGMSNDDEVAALVKSIPIIHVHGQLDFLPWQDKSKGYRGYGGFLTPERLTKASQSIKIIHEDTIEKDLELRTAKEVVKKARYGHFLGFGYDITNIKRLCLNDNVGGVFKGTGFGLKYNQRDKAQEFLKSISVQVTINDIDIVKYFEVTRFL